jgi:hypothetical protein
MPNGTLFTLSDQMTAWPVSDAYNALEAFRIFPLSLWAVPQRCGAGGVAGYGS